MTDAKKAAQLGREERCKGDEKAGAKVDISQKSVWYLHICWCYCHNLTHCRTSFPWIQVEGGFKESGCIFTSYHSLTRAWHRDRAHQAIVPSRCRLSGKTDVGSGSGEPEQTIFLKNNNFNSHNWITWVCQVLCRKWSLSQRWKVGVCDGRRPS